MGHFKKPKTAQGFVVCCQISMCYHKNGSCCNFSVGQNQHTVQRNLIVIRHKLDLPSLDWIYVPTGFGEDNVTAAS